MSASAQVWKTLPKGVRILGYRNVTTSEIKSNYNQFRSESTLGTRFSLDGQSINRLLGDAVVPGEDINSAAFAAFTAGEYELDVSAQFNVNGTGFGYGLTDKVMVYVEASYYTARVKANFKRVKNNTYKQTADLLRQNPGNALEETVANNLDTLQDVNEPVIQQYIQKEQGYEPLGDWYGSGYGDMETGLMANVIDRGYWGVMLYPGVVLPTGRVDDPDILQDVGFGDGQTDLFLETATGYIMNDYLSLGTSFRYTYQSASNKNLRVPDSKGSNISPNKGEFNVKYGDKLNYMVNSTIMLNDWLSVTPTYRFLYQFDAEYVAQDAKNSAANEYLAYNSNRMEHQVQLTTTLTTIQPFMKKKFLLPAQINMNLVQTVGGRNVPKVGRFELELRMLF